jgi:hypothetical protein
MSGSTRRARRGRQFTTAGGRKRRISRHIINNPHPEVDRRDMAYALSRWKLRGLRTDPSGRLSWNYYALVPRLNHVVRVVISLDDTMVVTAFLDQTADGHWKNGNLAYFANRLQLMQERGLERWN